MTAPPFDLLDPDFYVGDPHPAYRWMREHEPFYRDAKNGLTAVTRLEELREVERRAEDFVSGRGYRASWNPDEKTMISKDDPAHLAQRKLLAPGLTPRAVLGHEPAVRSLVQQLVADFVDLGRVEVVDGLAARLPATLTARLLGLDDAHWRNVKVWSERLMRIDRMQHDMDLLMDGIGVVREFGREIERLVAQRRREPQDDWVSIWSSAELDGAPMDLATMIDETGLLVSGGAETTRTTIARALVLFCEHPEAWEALAADPARIPCAVEELLRFITPLNNMFRTAVREATVGTHVFEPGERVILLYPSANRDATQFDEPDRFDIARDPNPHIAFGFGTHFCLGASFARMTLRVVFEELVQRITGLRPVAEPRYEANVFVKAVQRFDLAFDLR